MNRKSEPGMTSKIQALGESRNILERAQSFSITCGLGGSREGPQTGELGSTQAEGIWHTHEWVHTRTCTHTRTCAHTPWPASGAPSRPSPSACHPVIPPPTSSLYCRNLANFRNEHLRGTATVALLVCQDRDPRLSASPGVQGLRRCARR